MKTFKRIILVTLAFFTLAQSSNAQILEWAKRMGASMNDFGRSIATDNYGNVYTTGAFSGTVDFNPGIGVFNLTSAGTQDIFISKLDGLGNFVWAKRMGGAVNAGGAGITVDNVGNVYLTGSFHGTVDFDPGPGIFNLTSGGLLDNFVAKLDALGNFIWAKRMGGVNYDISNSIVVDDSGYVYTSGYFQDSVDFDPGVDTFSLISFGYTDVFISKLDSLGNFVWAKQIGGVNTDSGLSIQVDGSGNVFTTGYVYGIVDFDPGVGTYILNSTSGYSTFISKLDALGNFMWAKIMGVGSSVNGLSIAVDTSGNVYTAGVFNDSVDFNPGGGLYTFTSISLSGDIFLSKLDPSGNFIWAKHIGGTGSDMAQSIDLDASGNIFVTGRFEDTVDFDPGVGVHNLISAGGQDIFLSKLDASGNFIWAKRMGGINDDYGNSITVDSFANIYSIGNFSATVDFDPGVDTFNLTSIAGYDIYIHKMFDCVGASGTDIQSACNAFTWIDGITYSSSNNTAIYNFIGGAASGCDSVVTLNLTITNSASGIDTKTACHSYTWINGVTYTTSNSTATFNIVGGAANGCDSLVTLNLTVNTVSDITTSTNGATITANNNNGTYRWLDCNSNNAVIVGATNQSYTAILNGNYAVEITENDCVDTSICVLVNTIGIIENSFGNDFEVYPNPTSGNFSIDLGENHTSIVVTITDLNGKRIQTVEFNNAELLNLRIDEPAGIYIVTIKSEKNKAVIRVVKA